MNNTVQITWRGITQSPALDADIREKAAKLAQIHDRINRCRVVLEQAERRSQQGRPFAVHLSLTIPSGEIAVTREHDEDAHVAVRDAFDAARRQLQDFVRLQRDEARR